MELRTRSCASACLWLLGVILVAGAGAGEIEWESIGAQDAEATGLEVFRCYGGYQTILSTTSGFREYLNQGHWEVYEEPGAPAREARHVVEVYRSCGPFFSGRADTLGHGYIERSEDGAPGEIRYSSNTGFFVDIYPGDLYIEDMWACSRSGDEPGELIHSPYRGLEWDQVLGHGHQDLTDIQVFSEFEIYVAGDAGVAFTPDSGDTWQDISNGLPAGTIRYLWDEGPAYDVPDAKRDYVRILYACTDSGLFTTPSDVIDWNPVLDTPCFQAGRQPHNDHPAGVMVLTDDGRILSASEGEWNWTDITANLAGEEIVRLVGHGLPLVATATSGVWQLYPTGNPNPVPEMPPFVALKAAPNPFNPVTTLSYEVPREGHAVLEVYDLAGRRVATLLDGHVTAGPGAVTWRPQELASGVYLARLVVGTETARKRLVLLK